MPFHRKISGRLPTAPTTQPLFVAVNATADKLEIRPLGVGLRTRDQAEPFQ
jgi:hypothetical protein